MKVMKTFDPWVDMPMDIRDKFFEDAIGFSNDCYVTYCVEPYEVEELEDGGEIHKYESVTLWLLEQGCAISEEVLVKHYW